MNARLQLRRPASNQRGATLLEFALILPLFLLLIIGCLEFARAFNIWQVVVNAAREGARTVALPPGSQSNDALVQSRIDNYLASNRLDPTQATSSWSDINAPPGSIDSCSVSYPYTFAYFGRIVTLMGGSSAGTIDLTSTSRMRNE